ncbi:hypothetical protein CAEBREN_29072 [Caenorhabditis brenneri]|uniref:SMB domain-containing protein n=1 Tax=Caenorhabditis brenneri TaxID=135651 RepID=G0P7Q9_CAEBE|nr:hypothetical protein CAEBREN_29072 [Caenorhabditis brenneri]
MPPNSVLFLLVICATIVDSRGFFGIPGDYCSTRTHTCCENRDDDCTVPILGDHLCYCDMFCDRGPDGGNDCCPDFEATCRGKDIQNDQRMDGESCSMDGDTKEKNCEKCTCQNGLWKCDGTACLIQPDILEKLHTGRFSWTARNYSAFWGRSLSDGIKYRLGTLFPERSVQNMNEILIKPRELPEHFDSRDNDRRGLRCPSGSQDSTAFKMTPPYKVSSREEDIQTELMTNGPVQATFVVHEDFFMYAGGVYQHSDLAAQKGASSVAEGYHSVRVLGWGVDHSTGRPIKYWLCANSWGTQWGEDGYFKILRGDNHCEIESFVVGAWGKGSKRRRRFKMRKLRRFRKMFK